ncbi:MAG: BTAD domain-containing putative transcriptional regulator [Oscillochloridaceae bacterium]|nr:hypothetical protein [Chloroflexaceae bacterium]MDW8390341.1 BTAD domain-containing putative transcriptional regulator [Oscillochloridaceae bacterium]
MPLVAKASAPLYSPSSLTVLLPPALQRAINGGMTLVSAGPGFVSSAGLARALDALQRRCLWLRLGLEDRDPGMLLVSLIGALRRLAPAAGGKTLELMRRRPGPVAGWPPLFASFAEELLETLGPDGAVVLEACHAFDGATGALRLLGMHVLANLPPETTCVVITERSPASDALPARMKILGADDVRIRDYQLPAVHEHTGGVLPLPLLRRANALAEGRIEAFEALRSSCATLGCDLVSRMLETSGGLLELLTRLAQAHLSLADPAAQRNLDIALRIGYGHPDLSDPAPASGPWFEALEGDWHHLKTLWREPLRIALRQRPAEVRAIQRAVEALLVQGAVEPAVALLLDTGERAGAARIIARIAPTSMDLGQWDTLEEWLSQLSLQILSEWPWLVYISGELSAAQGQNDAAQRAFHLATRLFTARHDPRGACQSLLAESTLAVWQGESGLARARALAASHLAESSGLSSQQAWACWQLGCLAVVADDLDTALDYFERATNIASSAGDALMAALPQRASGLALNQRDLRVRCEFHRQTLQALEQTEREVGEALRALLTSTTLDIEQLLEAYGWAHLPLMLKLAAPARVEHALEVGRKTSLWGRLLDMLRGGYRQPIGGERARNGAGRTRIAEGTTIIGASERSPAGPLHIQTVPAAPGAASARATPAQAVAAAVEPETAARPAATGAAVAERTREASAPPRLSVSMLGSFRVMLNEHVVEGFNSGRGRAVFQYLIVHHDRPAPREVLMDCFWPDATPESARNSLNVAVHHARQAFRPLTNAPIILYKDGAYSLNPDLRLWIDFVSFERHVQHARKLEAEGFPGEACAAYEAALGLYQDDFLVDEPYEEWTVLTRERLRLIYLEALDRLSQIYMSQGRYGPAASLCQLILARDNCREDAHARLMRCYSRQGQLPLAIRQYQLCVQALATELNIGPSPMIETLYEQLRRRETV